MEPVFKALFSPVPKTYHYDLPLDEVRKRIEFIFNEPRGLLEDADFAGRFTGGETFEMEIISMALSRTGFRSVLYGTLQKAAGNETIVVTSTKPAAAFKILFWGTLIVSGIYLVKQIYEHDKNLVALYSMILGPLLSAKFAAICNGIIDYRYRKFIHQEIE